MSNNRSESRSKFPTTIVVIGAALLAGWYFIQDSKSTSARAETSATAQAADERTALYQTAVAQVQASAATWPKSEPELLRKFWKSIAAKNLKSASLYCPGSKEADFSSYTKMQTIEQIQVGTPEPHPVAKGVTLWPIVVKIADIGDKTIKLAVVKIGSGQLVIDGQNSIWW